MDDEQKGKGLRFDATINAGHILTFISLVVAGFVTWGVMDRRVAVVEERQRAQVVIDAGQDAQIQKVNDRVERNQDKLEQKIDRIIDMIQKGKGQ